MLDVGLGLFAWNLVAFLVVLFLLRKFAWKPIISSLNERETNIADAIATAEKVKAEMATLKNENEALMHQAREERALLLKDAKDTADKMVAEAKNKAKAEYDKIVADAQLAITQQKNAALTEVTNQVGALVIQVAEKVLRRELADKNQQEQHIKELAAGIQLN
jgi:F-type H+-transporting ATPase subunit b